ncbi:beta-ketoacyl [acyl carrier protein] synthase domain-containing protein [Nocardia australiensis]|uniref:beta-ketoacyl [acyl carrier protein] synthase domain-containing protein n=1 Tax=Nocardia australiensis TaxID=2887191 RepID=UPI001D145BD0|nr:polyketide synthase [Nocardia australiensis]
MDEPDTGVRQGAALRRATETIKRLRAELDQRSETGPIAVVGAGLRLAGGIGNLDDYWSALLEGRDLIGEMPMHRRWPFEDEWAQLPLRGGFIPDALDFDPEFFGITPRAAQAIDPQHRLLLEVAWEALCDSRIDPVELRGEQVGTFVGITGRQDYADWARQYADAHWALGNGHSFAPGRIAYTFGFTGPAVAFDTACSSAMVAIVHAVQSLRRGEVEIALAGGVNLILAPGSTRAIDRTGSLSPDGLCRTFDARANGFVRGEGCSLLVLKRLADAQRDRDSILGVIRGVAMNQDGRTSGFSAPNAEAQRRVIEAALADAGCGAADLGLVEAHGTGTSLGDPIEMSAIVAALAARNGARPLHVGSVKTNFGHLEGASGAVGLVKALLTVRERMIPPLVHFDTLNPRIELNGHDIRTSGRAVPWLTPECGSMAGVSSFGIIGTNAHIVVGPAPQGDDRIPPRAALPRPQWRRVPCVPAFLGDAPPGYTVSA